MGKPYKKELEDLLSTYRWALSIDVSSLAHIIRASGHLSCISVGSGGSYSAAELHAYLHRKFYKSIAQAVTPLELISACPRNGSSSVYFMSASGNNVDVRRSFKHAVLTEQKFITAIIGKEGSKVSKLGDKYRYTNIFEYPLPCGGDGFLATNSLVGLSLILYRAYLESVELKKEFSDTLDKFLFSRISNMCDFKEIEKSTEGVWNQERVHVIYSPELKCGAIDIESKFIEAGLGSIHLSDLRNFAHGRHNWFSKNSSGVGIIALTTTRDKELAVKTLELLPESISKSHIEFAADDGTEALVALILSLYFTAIRGNVVGIDPGRPGVPSYGSKIYRLTTKSGFIQSIARSISSIERKVRSSPLKNDNSIWIREYNRFLQRLSKKKFGAIVLDYDGTVVDNRDRTSPPSPELMNELNRLLDAGIKIGFATGRGKSIREALKSKVGIKKEYWTQVYIGYYNGADIGKLEDDDMPDRRSHCGDQLSNAVAILNRNLFITTLDNDLTIRREQVTIEPRSAVPETLMWEIAEDLLGHKRGGDLTVVRSSHSIDIITRSASKLAIVDKLKREINHDLEILAIGDRGKWPGNDSELLSIPCSLSVDEVSYSDQTCWNICPAGVRGPQGTLYYLSKLSGTEGIVIYK